jgi:hypothetical protein
MGLWAMGQPLWLSSAGSPLGDIAAPLSNTRSAMIYVLLVNIMNSSVKVKAVLQKDEFNGIHLK